jgi:hypothetical protein
MRCLDRKCAHQQVRLSNPGRRIKQDSMTDRRSRQQQMASIVTIRLQGILRKNTRKGISLA